MGTRFGGIFGIAWLLGAGIVTHTHAATMERGAAGAATTHENAARVLEQYGKLPLHFVENKGQLAGDMRYYEQGLDHSVYFFDDGVMLTLKARGADAPPQTVHFRTEPAGGAVALRGERRQSGEIHYLIGDDPAHWQPHVQTYQSVRYQNVYPGIDLAYYGTHDELEYDFIVAPGADPSRIQLSVRGAEKLSVNAQGELEISLPSGTLIERKPVIYQTLDGVRKPVAGRYRLLGAREDNIPRFGFEIAHYDRRAELVIDPILAYASYFGGNRWDVGTAIAVDDQGYAYVSGYSQSDNYPTTSGTLTPQRNDWGAKVPDAVITKFSMSGAQLVYSTHLGGHAIRDATGAVSAAYVNTGRDEAAGIAVDRQGYVYVAGITRSSDFPTTAGAYQREFHNRVCDSSYGTFASYWACSEGFIAKLSPDGASLVYATLLGGSGEDRITGVALDANNNVYVAGSSNSLDFPTTASALQRTVRKSCVDPSPFACRDAFVAKLNASGSALVYSTLFGGTDEDAASAIALDANNNAYIAGNTGSANLPTTTGALRRVRGNLCVASFCDAFVAKINVAGNALVYSTYLGGSNGFREASAIAVDLSGNAHVAGHTSAADFPVTAGVFGAYLRGDIAGFVSKLNAAGTGLVYATFLSGAVGNASMLASTEIKALALDQTGNAYVTGITYESDFPLVDPVVRGAAASPSGSAFLSKIDATGSALLFSTLHRGIGTSMGLALALDDMNNVYITGNSNGNMTGVAPCNPNGDLYSNVSTLPIENAFQPVENCGGDGIIAKFNLEGPATQRVSLANGVSSQAPTMSATTRHVAFSSRASNLVAGDTNNTPDVFVRDRRYNRTARISVGPGGAQANGGSYDASISGDGRYVAFVSAASNLAGGDTNGEWDVFVHDRDPDGNGEFDEGNGQTRRVSVGRAGAQANGGSMGAVISANGRHVAYASLADNLVAFDMNGAIDVFVYDRDPDGNGVFDEGGGVTTRMSLDGFGLAGNSHSFMAAINGDGRFVTFASLADNLAPNDNNGAFDIFVRDRDPEGNGVFDDDNGATTLVSRGALGAANGYSLSPAISANGAAIAFVSDATDIESNDTNRVADIYVYDIKSGALQRVSVNASGIEANAPSEAPALNEDGHQVAFASRASNLVSGDSNGASDVFVRTLASGDVQRISVANTGAPVYGDSYGPAISPDGKTVAFISAASNLVGGDSNAAADVFIGVR